MASLFKDSCDANREALKNLFSRELSLICEPGQASGLDKAKAGIITGSKILLGITSAYLTGIMVMLLSLRLMAAIIGFELQDIIAQQVALRLMDCMGLAIIWLLALPIASVIDLPSQIIRSSMRRLAPKR